LLSRGWRYIERERERECKREKKTRERKEEKVRGADFTRLTSGFLSFS